MKVWYLEAGHDVQVLAPVDASCAVRSWKVPTAHFSQEVLAAEAKVPSSQATQVDWPAVPWNLPAGHCTQVEAPPALK
jgi:hypothetical protein